MYKRERIGNTYIGKNIYISALSSRKSYVLLVFIIVALKSSYYDDSIDEDIKIAVGVFFPDKISAIHMELLKQLALYLKRRSSTEQYFQQAESSEDLYNLIINTNND
ncbi:PTS sugar transporter subunit IIA [Francisella noatunensis]